MEMFFCDLEKWNQGPTVQARYFNILLRGEINRIDFRFLTSDLHSIIVRAIEGRQMSSFMDLTTVSDNQHIASLFSQSINRFS